MRFGGPVMGFLNNVLEKRCFGGVGVVGGELSELRFVGPVG